MCCFLPGKCMGHNTWWSLCSRSIFRTEAISPPVLRKVDSHPHVLPFQPMQSQRLHPNSGIRLRIQLLELLQTEVLSPQRAVEAFPGQEHSCG